MSVIIYLIFIGLVYFLFLLGVVVLYFLFNFLIFYNMKRFIKSDLKDNISDDSTIINYEIYKNGCKKRERKMCMGYTIPIPLMENSVISLLGAYEVSRLLKDKTFFGAKILIRPTVNEIRKLVEKIIDQFNPKAELLPQIQNYYDKIYGNLRIILYAGINIKKNAVIFRGEAPNNKFYNLCVYQNDKGQFFVVRNVKKLFYYKSSPKMKYCYECNALFNPSKPYDHTRKCKVLCSSCFNYGKKCKKIVNEEKSCTKCKRYFLNQQCFDNHLRKVCSQATKCLDCDQEIIMDAHRHNTNKHFKKRVETAKESVHKHYEKKCWKCFTYHLPYDSHLN